MKMKLSKLDPMTVLMVVVAFGVVVTMLTQNSVASVGETSANASSLEKKASPDMSVSTMQINTARHASYRASDASKAEAVKLSSKAAFF
jgi:hypothetical protein